MDEGPGDVEVRRDGRVERGRTTRERLIRAARGEFGRNGYDATSIEAILRSAAVARGALYHHFDSKEQVFDAVLDTVIGEIARTAATAARGKRDPMVALRAACFAWLDAALDPAVQRIALLDPAGAVGWARWRELDEQHVLAGLRHILELAAEKGQLPRADVPLLARMLLAAVSEAALSIAHADDPTAAARSGKRTVGMLLGRVVSAS